MLQGLSGAISTSAEMTTGRLSGTVATPMAVRAWLPVSVPYRSMLSFGGRIEHGGGLWVAGFGVDVAVDHKPGVDAVEIAERRFEAGEGGETGGVLCLLECHLAGYLAEGSGG